MLPFGTKCKVLEYVHILNSTGLSKFIIGDLKNYIKLAYKRHRRNRFASAGKQKVLWYGTS